MFDHIFLLAIAILGRSNMAPTNRRDVLNSQWVLGLAAGLVVVFSITMLAGHAGSDWFKDEVEQSLLSIHGLDGLAQASVSNTRPAVSIAHPVAVNHERTLDIPQAVKAASTNALSSPARQKLEGGEHEESNEEPEPEVEEPEEVEDCPIKLANGKSFIL